MLVESEVAAEYFEDEPQKQLKAPNDFRIKNQKLARSDSRVSTDENSVNYSVNIKTTSKQIKRFLINETNEKLLKNNKQIRELTASGLKEVKLKDFKKQVEILNLKKNLLDDLNSPRLVATGFLSDESRGALKSAPTGMFRKGLNIRNTREAIERLYSDPVYFKADDGPLLDNEYFNSIFQKSDFREMAVLSSEENSSRPVTVGSYTPNKRSSLVHRSSNLHHISPINMALSKKLIDETPKSNFNTTPKGNFTASSYNKQIDSVSQRRSINLGKEVDSSKAAKLDKKTTLSRALLSQNPIDSAAIIYPPQKTRSGGNLKTTNAPSNINSKVSEYENEPMKSLVLIKNQVAFSDNKKLPLEQTEPIHQINDVDSSNNDHNNPLGEKFIIGTFINRNEIDEVFSKGKEEDDDHERGLRKIELELERRLEEIKERMKPAGGGIHHMNSSGTEASSNRKSNTQYDKVSTPLGVESPTRKRTFLMQDTRISNQGTEKKKKTVMINTPLSNEKTDENEDENNQAELDSPSNMIKERVYKIIGGDVKNKQRMIDEFYQKMLRSEGIFQIPIEGGTV
jgi:hypothetical protein